MQPNIVSRILSINNFVLDAAAFEMDVSGSTITYPATGTGSVVLRRASNNTIVAAQTFAWKRIGSVITFSNPNAVNQWAYANSADADSFTFEANPFSTNIFGSEVVSVAARYEDEVLASHSRVVHSDCGEELSEHQCIAQ